MFFQSFVLMSSLSSQVQEGRPRVDIQAGEKGDCFWEPEMQLPARRGAKTTERERERERERGTQRPGGKQRW